MCGHQVAACDPFQSNTTACLQSRNKATDPTSIRCFECVRDNGCLDPAQAGGACEDTTGTAPVACEASLSVSTPVSETSVCLATLDKIFQSGCAATLQLTPCLCGSSDAGKCLAGDPTAPPVGPVESIYACELGSTGPAISNNFTVQTFGAGQANALAQCAGAFGCDCF
jgi:hypothetical protein